MNIIRNARENKKMTQKELSELAGVSIRTIQSIEQGKRRPGQLLTLKLFKILDIPIANLEIFLQQYTTKCSL